MGRGGSLLLFPPWRCQREGMGNERPCVSLWRGLVREQTQASRHERDIFVPCHQDEILSSQHCCVHVWQVRALLEERSSAALWLPGSSNVSLWLATPSVGGSWCRQLWKVPATFPGFRGSSHQAFSALGAQKENKTELCFILLICPGKEVVQGLDLSWTSFKHIFLSMETFPLRPYDPSSGVFVTHTK